jgi:hypothetical protein
MQLDHLVWASPSLDTAVAAFREMSGVAAVAGGRHVGIGSHNALADLGGRVYLAIDGPDEDQPLEDNYGARLKALPGASLTRFAVQTDDLEAARAALARHGFDSAPKPGGRTGTTGERYEWQTLAATDLSLGAAMPIIKSWLTPNHPSTECPGGCRLLRLTVAHPEAERVRRLYADLGLDLPVARAAVAMLTAEIECKKGRFVLTGAKE